MATTQHTDAPAWAQPGSLGVSIAQRLLRPGVIASPTSFARLHDAAAIGESHGAFNASLSVAPSLRGPDGGGSQAAADDDPRVFRGVAAGETGWPGSAVRPTAERAVVRPLARTPAGGAALQAGEPAAAGAGSSAPPADDGPVARSAAAAAPATAPAQDRSGEGRGAVSFSGSVRPTGAPTTLVVTAPARSVTTAARSAASGRATGTESVAGSRSASGPVDRSRENTGSGAQSNGITEPAAGDSGITESVAGSDVVTGTVVARSDGATGPVARSDAVPGSAARSEAADGSVGRSGTTAAGAPMHRRARAVVSHSSAAATGGSSFAALASAARQSDAAAPEDVRRAAAPAAATASGAGAAAPHLPNASLSSREDASAMPLARRPAAAADPAPGVASQAELPGEARALDHAAPAVGGEPVAALARAARPSDDAPLWRAPARSGPWVPASADNSNAPTVQRSEATPRVDTAMPLAAARRPSTAPSPADDGGVTPRAAASVDAASLHPAILAAAAQPAASAIDRAPVAALPRNDGAPLRSGDAAAAFAAERSPPGEHLPLAPSGRADAVRVQPASERSVPPEPTTGTTGATAATGVTGVTTAMPPPARFDAIDAVVDAALPAMPLARSATTATRSDASTSAAATSSTAATTRLAAAPTPSTRPGRPDAAPPAFVLSRAQAAALPLPLHRAATGDPRPSAFADTVPVALLADPGAPAAPDAAPASTVRHADAAGATSPAGAALPAGATVDLDDLVERACQAVFARLVVEHERRGYARWA